MASPSGIKRSGLPRLSSGLNTPIRGSRESLTGTVDDWIIGDRCWISGSKSGKVAFLGETRFAQGEWAGVALDEPTGKNDGSVGGVRYFQCPSNCGIFCRVNKLNRKPEHNVVADQAASLLSESAAHANLQQKSSVASNEEDMSHSITVSNFDDDAAFTDSKDSDGQTELKVGDRVVVSGSKNGILRFVGATEFAQGSWGGVELDQPIGKNDGSVQGKRYFACKPRYGLFAPMAKITAAPMPKSVSASKKLQPVRQTVTSNLRLNKNLSRAGSQESLSSLSSAQSSASRRKTTSVRGGSIGPSASTVASPTVNAYQESLKEKEQHVDQLMRERDIERSEMARLAHQLEETRQELSELKDECKRSLTESQMQKDHLHTSLETSEVECRRLTELLDEEKRRTEDLQFRIEEESIMKMDLEGKISELLNQVGNESKKSNEKNQSDLVLQSQQAKIDSLNSKMVNLEQTIAENRRTETNLREALLKKETEMESKLRDKEDLIQNAEAEIFKLREDAEHLHTDCENERKLCEQLKTTKEKMEKDITDCKVDMEKLLVTNNQLTKDRENFEKSLSSFKEEKTKEIEPMSVELQNKTKELERLKAEFDLVHIQLEELQRKANDSVEKLDAESVDKEKKLSKLEVANKNLKMQLENQRVELEKMSMLATNSKLSSDSVQQTVLDLKIQKDSLTDQLSVLEKDAITNRESLKNLQSELVSAREQLKSQSANEEVLSKEISDLKASSESLEKNRATLEKDNLRITQELLDARTSNEQSSKAFQDKWCEEKSQFESKISTLNEELSKKNTEFEQLSTDKAKSEERLMAMEAQQSEYVALQTVKQTLTENNSKLDEELVVLKNRVEDLEKNCAQLEAEKSHLSNDLAALKSLSEQNLEESTKTLVFEKEKISTELFQLKSEAVILKNEHEKLLKEKQTLDEKLLSFAVQENEMKLLNEKLISVNNTVSQLNSELSDAKQNSVDLKENCTSLQKEIADLKEFLASSASNQNALVAEKSQLLDQKQDLEKNIEQYKQQTVAMKNELETVSKDKASLEEKFKVLSEEAASSSKTWMEEKTTLRSEMQKQMELLMTNKKEIEDRLNSASSRSVEFETEKQKLYDEFQNLKQKLENLSNVEESNKILLADCEALREREIDLEKETKLLKDKLNQLTLTLSLKDSELETVQKAKNQATELITLNNEEFLLLKNENLKLTTKLKDLDILKSASVPQKETTPTANVQISASSNDLEREVAFCNSVIADLVQKNQELQLKVDIFMNGGVNMVGNSSLPRIPKPRLFCDICEIFDAHETEDCPKQAGEEEESQSHSHFNGVRNEVRSYCDNCEVFGHSTENCDQETF